MKEEFSKYERARILGARALQVSMDAPILIKIDEETLNGVNFDPLRIAEIELDSGVLPISVKRPLPQKKEEDIKKIRIAEPTSDEEKIQKEQIEEKEIAEEGEIMQLVTPEDEVEESSGGGGDGGELEWVLKLSLHLKFY